MPSQTITIPARGGKAAHIQKGQIIRVINTHGDQVIDTWAFDAGNLEEIMSMEHSRVHFLKLRPEIGDTFVTNQRRPILTLVEDTSPGIHDILMAACDENRYKLLGCTGYHQNCADNLSSAMAALGLKEPKIPPPLNLFMNIPWTEKGGLSFGSPVSSPGDYVVLRAEIDAVIAFSACPQDLMPINGQAQQPTEAHFQVSSCP